MCSSIHSSLSWERRIQIYLPLPVTSTVEQSPQHCFICNKTVLWASTSRDRETSVECNQIHTSHYSRGWRLRRVHLSNKTENQSKGIHQSFVLKYWYKVLSTQFMCILWMFFNQTWKQYSYASHHPKRHPAVENKNMAGSHGRDRSYAELTLSDVLSKSMSQLYFHLQPPGG